MNCDGKPLETGECRPETCTTVFPHQIELLGERADQVRDKDTIRRDIITARISQGFQPRVIGPFPDGHFELLLCEPGISAYATCKFKLTFDDAEALRKLGAEIQRVLTCSET